MLKRRSKILHATTKTWPSKKKKKKTVLVEGVPYLFSFHKPFGIFRQIHLLPPLQNEEDCLEIYLRAPRGGALGRRSEDELAISRGSGACADDVLVSSHLRLIQRLSGRAGTLTGTLPSSPSICLEWPLVFLAAAPALTESKLGLLAARTGHLA